MNKYFIAIAGNIGVGKSTLTTLLSREMGWEPFYEAVDDNPYLADFYQDMRAWGFHSQIFFLSRRLHHHYQLMQRPNTVVQDRSVYEDAEIFACNLYRQGLMSERDYASYRELYDVVCALLPPPTLLIYLRGSVDTLLGRIATRGRDFERDISGEYLAQLNELYEEWVGHFTRCPILTISTDGIDFKRCQEHRCMVFDQIRAALHAQDLVQAR
ncbi:MAG: deoxynucleoside kinase [Chloroflexi bacterium]|jgi:deoxyadenosine/deoxycytidine kinase|nr:deoxynucleoside kinase [Chloroflexota bacterium]